MIGFDDIPMAAWSAYALTTVRQPVDAMVEATVDPLLARIAEPSAEPVLQQWPGTLIRRGSARLVD